MSQRKTKPRQSAETYAFKEGFRCPVKAALVGTELERLRKEGPLTTHAVFEAARPEDAPLHPAFEWDGEKAIEALGHIRARTLMRAVFVVSTTDEGEEIRHRAYALVGEVGSASPGRYELMTTVAKSPDLYQQAFAHLQGKFEAAEEALGELRRLAEASPNAERLAAIGLVEQGFSTVREALQLLKT